MGSVIYRGFSQCQQSSTQYMESEEELSACISDVLTKFQSISGLYFKLKRKQEIAVESMLMNRDVLVVLPTGYTYLASGQQNNTREHEGVCPLTSIIKEQIAEARSLGIKSVSLLGINFLRQNFINNGNRACMLLS